MENEIEIVLSCVHILFKNGFTLSRKDLVEDLSEGWPDVNWNQVIDQLILNKKIKEISWAIDHTVLPGQILPYMAQIATKE